MFNVLTIIQKTIRTRCFTPFNVRPPTMLTLT